MNILNAFAKALEEREVTTQLTKMSGLRQLKESHKEKQLMQLTRFPITVDADLYRNAKSSSNPKGSLQSLFNFRQLVDPIPSLGSLYQPTIFSTEMMYGNILGGMSVFPADDFVISESKMSYEVNVFSGMDGIPGNWRPVYAVPEDWHSADDSRFKRLTIDLTVNKPSTLLEVIAGDEEFKWIVDGHKIKELNIDTHIESIEMKYMLVGLRRPWLNPSIFQMGNWYFSGEDPGFCSSGSITDNDGILPVIPSGIIIGKEISINASWHKDDQTIIDRHKVSGNALSLGPFSVSDNHTIQIIGWISEVVPFSPKKKSPPT